jgi:hypothetical protein
MANPYENVLTSIVNKSKQDTHAQPWKAYAITKPTESTEEWVKIEQGKVNVLTNAFQI